MTDTPLSSPTDVERKALLAKLVTDIYSLLEEKKTHYGQSGGFYEANANGNYSHAIGECRLKLNELSRTGNRRVLLKAITWLYLIYETEELRGSRKD